MPEGPSSLILVFGSARNGSLAVTLAPWNPSFVSDRHDFNSASAPPGDAPEGDLDQLARHLVELGAETETERAVKRIAPWVGSFLIHLGLIVLGFLIVAAWRTVASEEESVIITADYYQLEYEPLASLQTTPSEEDQTPLQDQIEVESVEQMLDERFAEVDTDSLQLISDAASRSRPTTFAPEAREGTAKFAGLTGTNARRIVFIVDASGSMIGTLQIVLDELARSIDQLSPQQSFAIIFFQENQALAVPPADRLIPAERDEKIRALKWVNDQIIPKGRSNPLEAIQLGMRLKPDVIFMLSNNITGSGQYEIDQSELLATLDRLNPVTRETGQRATQIQCIQFLDPDPLDTLRKIAEAHSGPHGYRFLSRRELGLGVR